MSTVKSDFWSDAYAFVRSGDTKNSSYRKIVARLLGKRQMRRDRALIAALLGAAAGATATATLKRIAHSTTELGGKRTMETNTFVNRATTAGDVTDLTAALLTFNSRPTYAVDKATRP